MSAGADLNCKNSTGRTPLHIAVQKHRINLVKELLKLGANKTIRDTLGMSPYEYTEGDQDIRALFDNPALLTAPTPIQKTCKKCGHNITGKFCLECGTKVV